MSDQGGNKSRSALDWAVLVLLVVVLALVLIGYSIKGCYPAEFDPF